MIGFLCPDVERCQLWQQEGALFEAGLMPFV
jgi:hypothetical protein